MTMVDSSQIFDVWYILSNYVIGDVWLTIVFMDLIILYSSVKLKLKFEVIIMMQILIMLALFTKTQLIIIYTLVVLIVGLISYWIMSKVIE